MGKRSALASLLARPGRASDQPAKPHRPASTATPSPLRASICTTTTTRRVGYLEQRHLRLHHWRTAGWYAAAAHTPADPLPHPGRARLAESQCDAGGVAAAAAAAAAPDAPDASCSDTDADADAGAKVHPWVRLRACVRVRARARVLRLLGNAISHADAHRVARHTASRADQHARL